jgi:hypothetical protein
MHDLKSESLADAINRHRGEAREVIEKFREGLSPAQQQQVLVFLKTLRSQSSVVGATLRSRQPGNPTLPHRTREGEALLVLACPAKLFA